MKFGLFSLLGQREWQEPKEIYSALLEQADAAEDLGYDAIWMAEHHFCSYGTLASPAVLGAAIAERTKRLRIGTGITVLPFHDPRRLAEDFATLDVLSNGRLDFGVGRGYQPAEFAAMGVPMSESRTRAAEALDIIEGLWTQDDFSYHGQHFQIEGLTLHPKPIQSPPPIWMAAVSPETMEIAARAGRAIVQGPQIIPLQKVKANYGQYRSMLAESGHDPSERELRISRMVYCAPTSEAAHEDAADSLMWYHRTNTQRLASPKVSDPSYSLYQQAQAKASKIEYQDLLSSGDVFFDTPDRIIPEIQKLRDELDLEYLFCFMEFPGLDSKLVLKSIERFAREVMPEFADDDDVPSSLPEQVVA